jgi:hypothetical protein
MVPFLPGPVLNHIANETLAFLADHIEKSLLTSYNDHIRNLAMINSGMVPKSTKPESYGECLYRHLHKDLMESSSWLRFGMNMRTRVCDLVCEHCVEHVVDVARLEAVFEHHTMVIDAKTGRPVFTRHTEMSKVRTKDKEEKSEDALAHLGTLSEDELQGFYSAIAEADVQADAEVEAGMDEKQGAEHK